MNAVDRIHNRPCGAPIEIDTPDVLVHALARLRKCGDDSIRTLVLTDELPEVVLPWLTWAASRRSDIPASTIRILMKCCGEEMLQRALGLHRLRLLKQRFGYITAPYATL